ncbi:DUF899 family protein [Kitasatospora atroaurantiaca]|uniref:Putative dithiol-disulfide oxidoreductase (DUF899 family) n=1 Tax=Kitasatospora atroaurantiaca TaxID=285545 RepID=A0A561EYQ6_9ACTN|nr:DUF899 family protein [Kitasatospora atroaurantiaca]TWE20738.1 putative dithiol-disulfide oxidoreductase (DUF899 family) [Kitasatospora atroaurantiaca]
MDGPLHWSRLPRESDAYRRARDDLLRAEIELRRQTEAVAAQRRRLPLGGEVRLDYSFDAWDPSVGTVLDVRLSELFEDGKDALFLYSFMYLPGRNEPAETPCPVCTSIIDGIDGAVPHITQHVNFAVVAKAPVERFGAHARARGWRNVRLLSSRRTTFNVDYLAEDADGAQSAVATVFVRRGGRIHHFWSSELQLVDTEPGQHPRHVDFMWPLWAVVDRTPAGREGSWMPRLEYD